MTWVSLQLLMKEGKKYTHTRKLLDKEREGDEIITEEGRGGAGGGRSCVVAAGG